MKDGVLGLSFQSKTLSIQSQKQLKSSN